MSTIITPGTIERRPELETDEPHGPGPGSKSRWWLWLLVIAALGYGVYRLQKGSSGQQTSPAGSAARSGPRSVPVVAAPARQGDMPVYLRGLGSVTAYNTVTVKSRVDGQLVKVAFREGQFVHPGDLLAEIDPRPFQVQLIQAEGQKAKDEAALKNARIDLERYKVLIQEDS